ncbi:Predicted arabinose efflux permease, MFS family [Pseudonocardia thermophila]|jgi:Arabinose efflux permease|uniref:Predicted arabinose efflux permease, MFS family n=2 Tax=Pseudonocardia thermophila TaxID=1848 RepID=A0A1M6NDZ1_PSETH|nr:Predicted arabinose efflux permease, MFS family [Pseudonocardia thermophila]
MLPELGATYGVTPATAAASITSYLLPFAGLMLVSGTLGERWGRRRAVVIGYVVYAVAALAAVVAPTFELFLAARVVQGAANAFTTPLLLAAVGATAAPGRLGRALGWFGSLQSAGHTSAPLLGGLAAEVDWRWAFVGVAVSSAVLAVVGIPHTDPGPRTGLAAALRSAVRPEVLRLGLVAAVGWGLVAGLAFLVALRLEDAFAVSAGTRGLVLTALGVVGLLSARLVGGAVDRIGPRRTVLIGTALGAFVVAGAGLAPAVGLIAAIWALGGLAGQLLLVGVNSIVLAPGRENAGGAMSVVQAVRFSGMALAPAVITPIYRTDPLAAFLVPALLVAVVVPLALPRPNRPRVEDGAVAE